MKAMSAFYAVLAWFGTTAIAFANEATKEGGGGGYNATYVVWESLIVIILVWGVYDSFFRPID